MLDGLNKREWGVLVNFLATLTDDIVDDILDDASNMDMAVETNAVIDKALIRAKEQDLEL